MKRLLVIVLGFAAVVAAVALAAPAIISTDVVKDRIADQITHWTGRQVTFAGDPHISLFPYLTVRLRNVTIANPEGMDGPPFVTMDGLAGKLEILPLLLGRIEFAEFRMTNPHFNLAVDGSGHANWLLNQGAVGAQAAKGDSERLGDDVGTPAPLADIRLGRFIVRNGSLTLKDARSGYSEVVGDIDADLSWPSTPEAASGSGRFVWRDQPVEFNGSVAEPLRLIAGGSSALRVALASAPLKIAFDGTARRFDAIQLDGEATVSTASLRQVIAWMRGPIGDGAILGAGTISGRVNWVDGTVAFDQAKVALDGNEAEGALSVGFSGGRLQASGTLAFEKVDLTAYGEALRGAGDGPLFDMPLSLPFAAVSDLDLRLSANQAILGDLQLGHSAVAATLKDGKLALDIGEAQFLNGQAEADVAIEPAGDGLAVAISGKIDSAPLAAIVAAAGGPQGATGSVDAEFRFAAKGRSLREMVAGLDGNASLASRDLAIAALDGETVGRLVAGSGLEGSVPGRMPQLAAATCTVILAGGKSSIADFHASGDGMTITAAGSGELGSGEIAARGVIALAEPLVGAATEIPFRLGGTFASPTLSPDLGETIKPGALQKSVIPVPVPNG